MAVWSAIEIKPCPKCGEQITDAWQGNNLNGKYWYVGCMKNECQFTFGKKTYASKQEAIIYWNNASR